MKHIKPFIESKSITPTEDLFVDLIDYGFKLDSALHSNYQFTYIGEYDMIEVVELYNDALVKIKTFKDIKQTSFTTNNKSVKISFKVIDIIDNENHITVGIRGGVMNLLPTSYSIAVTRRREDIYYLLLHCVNDKGTISPVSWYTKDPGGIKDGADMLYKISDTRNFTIDKENAAKVLALIKSEAIGKTYAFEWPDKAKKSFDELTPNDLSNI